MGFFKTLFTGKEETEEEKSEQKAANDFDMFKCDGIQAMKYGKRDFAIACFEHALEIHDDVETRRYYANALLQNNDMEGTIEQFEEMRKLEPANAEIILTLAELCFEMERYEETEEACNAAIAINDKLAMPHYILAKMYKAQNDLFNAVAQATQAITNKEDYGEAYLLRAQILFSMQQYKDAEADIDVILDKNLDNDEILLMKAECCDAQEKNEEAKEYYNKVIELNPYVTKAYLQLGEILVKEGKKDEAAKIVEEGLKLAPDELKGMNGEYTNIEQETQQKYDSINPFA